MLARAVMERAVLVRAVIATAILLVGDHSVITMSIPL
jgi:hypothetical protein